MFMIYLTKEQDFPPFYPCSNIGTYGSKNMIIWVFIFYFRRRCINVNTAKFFDNTDYYKDFCM